MPAHYPWFTRRDLDGFFGLFVDNLVQLLLVVALCSGLCGMGGTDLLVGRILPGAAVSILVGNLFYAWQARRLALREGRDDVTALPYGINTPSLLVFVFFVMVPVYQRTGDPERAWRAGLLACLGSGVIELLGSFVAERIRRSTPRAALLSTLAGIAIGFIAMTFALQIFQRPLVAMLPLGIVMITYFARTSFPLGMPGGFVAVAIGTALAWGLTLLDRVAPGTLPASVSGPLMDASAVQAAWSERGFHPPGFFGAALWETVRDPSEWVGHLSVIVPMGLFNVIGSLQNIESAEAAGDRFDTRTSLAVNGLGTISAALCGSCFPTTIYIGHPGWKGLGARAGYSTLNGLAVVALCLTGTVGVVSRIVPMESGIAIVLWIGIVITAQAFQAVPHEHAPAVATGLFPAIAAWGATVVQGAFVRIGLATPGATTLEDLLAKDLSVEVNGFLLHGLVVMERGYIFTCMILAALAANLLDRRFAAAACWSCLGAGLAALGLTHSYQVHGNDVDFLFVFAEAGAGAFEFRAAGIALGYLLFAGLCCGFGLYLARHPQSESAGH